MYDDSDESNAAILGVGTAEPPTSEDVHDAEEEIDDKMERASEDTTISPEIQKILDTEDSDTQVQV
jgi:CHASE3 domain sensor protein